MQNRDWHPNTCPDFITYQELAKWGEDHTDPWVQKLGEIVGVISQNISEEMYDRSGMRRIETVEELVEIYHKDVKELVWEAEQAEEEQQIAEEALEEANLKIRSLKFQLDDDEQLSRIDELQSRIYIEVQRRQETDQKMTVLRSNYNELLRAHEELKAKYNTWMAIAT